MATVKASVTTLEAYLASGGVIDTNFSKICQSLDTGSSTNAAGSHCCYNSANYKLFCISGKTSAAALGIDTTTAGSCSTSGGANQACA